MSKDNEITYKQYWDEVAALAKSVEKEAKENESGADIHDLLHQAIDGHEWVIYTWAHPWVLIHSDNEDALFEQMGEQKAESYSQIMQQMTYFAMYEDVGQRIERDD